MAHGVGWSRSIALGVLLIFPFPGALGLVIWIGAYALVFGTLLLGLGFRLRGLKSPRAHQPAHSVA